VKRREKLTEEQVAKLKNLINDNSRSKKETLRAQAVLMINSNDGEDQIEMLTSFDKKHAFKLRKKYVEQGIEALIDKRKKKTRALLARNQRNHVIKIIKTMTPKAFGFDEKFWTTNILGFLINEQYSVQFKSKTPLYLLFKDARFTYHKPGHQYHKHNQELVDLWRADMKPVIEKALLEKDTVVLAEDEMILSTKTTFQKIWLPQGEFPKIEVSNTHARRCIYGFLEVKNGREHAFKTEKINSIETCKILDQIGKLYPNKKIVLIWDGAPWHHSQMIKDFLSSTKHNFHLYRFPPYAPEENPQEHVWKAGRSHVSHNKFIENIDKASREFVEFLNSTFFEYKFFNLGVNLA